MSHHHHHHKPNNLKLAFFLNLGFTIIEIIGGFWTNSVAILSDALHDLGDSLSLGLAWYLENYSKKESNSYFSYGYRRVSLLAALTNTIVLVIGSLIILLEAIPRLLTPEPTNATGMALLAILGIAINGWAAYRTSGESSLNAKVVSWHLLEDVLGWVAVLLGSIVMMIFDLPIIDPILSIVITLYVLWNVQKYLRQTVAIFLQAVPDGVDLKALKDQFRTITHVQSVHHTHLWSLDGDSHVLTTHIVVPPAASRADVLIIKNEIKEIVQDLNVVHMTIEVECEGEDCLMAQVQQKCHDHSH